MTHMNINEGNIVSCPVFDVRSVDGRPRGDTDNARERVGT